MLQSAWPAYIVGSFFFFSELSKDGQSPSPAELTVSKLNRNNF